MIENDELKLEETLKRLDFESKDEMKKRIKKLKEKLGLVIKLPVAFQDCGFLLNRRKKNLV